MDFEQVEHKQSKSPYYFADICAGPGGFSEYILWRKRWAFKGFGMTLRGDHDFKLHESNCASSESFEALYGILDNGDIYYPDNIKEFCSNIKNETNELGVHFVMADGVSVFLFLLLLYSKRIVYEVQFLFKLILIKNFLNIVLYF